jgi:SCY1-like protein 1
MTSTSRPTTAPTIISGLRPASSKPAASNPFSPPTDQQDNDDDDFDTSWGNADDDGADAWGVTEEAMTDPFAAPAPSTKGTSTSTEPAALFDDKGEPDFSGWLSAQAEAKKKTKGPLPKGLVKASAARPALGAKSSSTGGVGVKKALPAAKPKPTVAKKEEKVEEDDDAWGDAW